MTAWLLVLLLAGESSASSEHYATAIVEIPPNRVVKREYAQWSEWIHHDGDAPACAPNLQACAKDRLVIRNDSNKWLRCKGTIIYPQPNSSGIKNAEGTRVVRNGRMEVVVVSRSPAAMGVPDYQMECTPLPPLPPLDNPRECQMNMERSPDLDSYYPPEAKAAWHAGPVVLEMTAAAASAPPVDISVIRSSTFPELDDAARRALAAIPATTNCVGRRYRMIIEFKP